MSSGASDGDTVLTVENLSKKYCRSLRRSLLYGVRDIGLELVGLSRRSDGLRKGEFWALRHLSFELRKGESLGLIGPNGSGKTTLLRIIGGLIKPDAGAVRVRGTVAPLIALGAGFSPVLTGRENVHTNLAILGLSDRQIEKCFDAVLEFADIGEGIDAPVGTYSSGMAARLGFACAIHAEPDVFLIDEVLAVGDLRFRLKCYRKLAELREAGTTFILVSHNPHVVLANCENALYLDRGELRLQGAVEKVMAAYEQDLAQSTRESETGTLRLPQRRAEQSAGLDILDLSFRDLQRAPLTTLLSGRPVVLAIGVWARRAFPQIRVDLVLRERFGEGETVLRLDTANGSELAVPDGASEILLTLPYLGLKAGSYVIKLSVARESGYVLDMVEAFHFRVESTEIMNQCAFFQPAAWDVTAHDERSRSGRNH